MNTSNKLVQIQDKKVSYPVFAALEVVAMLGITWLAWTWRNDTA